MVSNQPDPKELLRGPNQSNAKETLRDPQAGGEETIKKLKELLELKPQSDIEKHVEEFEKKYIVDIRRLSFSRL